ncbi:putative microtubule-associated protein RP/EB family [Besnoitia besnoiti]|uniref:Putative microtubule-associated protein RP/EB family n=1 Tax=Besnoitia besnoiti TaxID=94643 RepID=A0A2A9MHA0_BESBE|nr:putative microtubule-associated protein RP/EB family [Besnoitia besnoiti]PFH35033.1 putative microtubule-associated protein RP/EB family [Besnoitia besnoiti]
MALTHASSGSFRDVDPSSVGMMEGAFFVSRTELLDWVNTTFNLSLTKIEQGASGAVYLQIVDGLFGGGAKVPMAKVKWNCKFDYEFIQNYKLLQSVFNKQGIKKHIEVDKLIKGKYQDNLEFLQWLKAFYDRQAAQFRSSDKPYNAFERRKLSGTTFPEWAQPQASAASGALSGAKETVPSAQGSSVSSSCSSPSPVLLASLATSHTPQSFPAEKRRAGASSSASASRQSSTPSKTSGRLASASAGDLPASEEAAASLGFSGRCASTSSRAPGASRELEAEIARLRSRLESLETEADQARLERDFYFQKLRRIELMCCSSSGVEALSVKDVLAVLYATDEDIDEEGDAREDAFEEALDARDEVEDDKRRRGAPSDDARIKARKHAAAHTRDCDRSTAASPALREEDSEGDLSARLRSVEALAPMFQ